MERKKGTLRWSALLCTVAILILCAVGAGGVKTRMNLPPAEAGVDTIVIDTLARFGVKDKPPVPFRQDFHTEVLAKQQKDCFACHLKENLPPFASADQGPQTKDRMSIKFMRLKDTNAKEVRKIYHDPQAAAGFPNGVDALPVWANFGMAGLDLRPAWTCLIGVILAIALNKCTRYFTHKSHAPVKSIARS